MSLLLRVLFVIPILTLMLASGAQAADHLLHVTEVHPSPQAPGLAFVELQDTGAEPFPAASYTLASFDVNGAELGRQAFTAPYGFAGTAQPFLVGGEQQQPRDAALTIPLAGARRVCFFRGTTQVIDCLAFDPAPDGRSAQRTSSGTAVFACPTPDAPNAQSAGACAGSAPPPASSGSEPAAAAPAQPASTAVAVMDRSAPTQVVSAGRTQRLGLLRLSVVVDERATLGLSGSIRVGTRKIALVRVARTAAAGTRTTVRPKLRLADARAVGRALRQGRRLSASVRIIARDAAGNVAVKTVKIALTP